MEQIGALSGRRPLVIEDDYLVAQILIQMLEDAGAAIIGPIGQIDEALSLIEHDSSGFDSVVLDVNLHGRASYPIADALIERASGSCSPPAMTRVPSMRPTAAIRTVNNRSRSKRSLRQWCGCRNDTDMRATALIPQHACCYGVDE